MAQTEHKRSVGKGRVLAVAEKSRKPVGGKAFLVVKYTVEGTARLVVEGRVNPGMIVADGQVEMPHRSARPGVVETV
jgi:hypothetical protein